MSARLRLAVFAALVALTSPSLAQSRLDDILGRGLLRVGTTGDYPPFTTRAADGTYSGLDADAAQSLAAALGVKVEFVATRWGDLTHDLAAGAFDIGMGGVSITLERQKTAFFSTPYLRDGKTPIARCADKEKFASLAEIDHPEVKVIVNPGGTNEKFDRTHLSAAQIELWSDNLTIFDQLEKGDADLMITDASETLYQQKRHAGVLCAIHPDAPFDFSEKAYLLPRDEALKAFVDQWLHVSRENGAFAAIKAKWLE
ncbi:MAG: transporter substrate-binding domain-containing protein [Bradyrhizobium sp.]|nr:MAG: transporter substrate-binding domain-containing protein [Bradyrhizobium sp.]